MNIPSLYFIQPIRDLKKDSESGLSFIGRRKGSSDKDDKERQKKYASLPFKGKNKGDQLDFFA